MTPSPETTAELFLAVMVDRIAERVISEVTEQIGSSAAGSSPWLTTNEAIQYTRLTPGTFKKLAASGKLPSHGGRSKVFYRPELDETLLNLRCIDDDKQRIRRIK